MYSEARKLHFIEKYLKVEDEGLLVKFESMIEDEENLKENAKRKPNIYEIVGMMDDEEVAIMKKAIEESAEKIFPDEWK